MAWSNEIKRIALMFPQSIKLEHYKTDVYLKNYCQLCTREELAREGEVLL